MLELMMWKLEVLTGHGQITLLQQRSHQCKKLSLFVISLFGYKTRKNYVKSNGKGLAALHFRKKRSMSLATNDK